MSTSNIERQLWAGSGGFCQNPSCNRPLLHDHDGSQVNISNKAHIIGQGKSGPRSLHELRAHIEIDGYENLLMLCSICHHVVDELEKKFSVEELRNWKSNHEDRIRNLFAVKKYSTLKELCEDVLELCEENAEIFNAYGPRSEAAKRNPRSDAAQKWRTLCVQEILPNNEKILEIYKRNREIIPHHLRRSFRIFRVHSNSFKDNCLSDIELTNNYLLFPRDFPNALRVETGQPSEVVEPDHQIDFRSDTMGFITDSILGQNENVTGFNVISESVVLVNRKRGLAPLRVFVTTTYIVNQTTIDEIEQIDPNVNVILVSASWARYSVAAKRHCIEKNVGLLNLAEFVAALGLEKEKYINYLIAKDRADRLAKLKAAIKGQAALKRVKIFVYGSFIRNAIFNDLDIILVAGPEVPPDEVSIARATATKILSNAIGGGVPIDMVVMTNKEYAEATLDHDNRTLLL